MKRVLLPVITLVLAAMGAAILWIARPHDPPPAPVPSVEVSVPSASPKGPVSGAVTEQENDADKPVQRQMSSDNMGDNSVYIPAIGAYHHISWDAGLDANESLELPESGNAARPVVRWNRSAALDATGGNTLLSGHVSWNGTLGVFFDLANVQAGDVAYLKSRTGTVEKFTLTQLHDYRKSSMDGKGLPSSVWRTDHAAPRTLTIVTCGGSVVHTSHGLRYDDNVVAVFTRVAH